MTLFWFKCFGQKRVLPLIFIGVGAAISDQQETYFFPMCNAVKCSAGQISAVQLIEMLTSAVHCNAV